MGCGVSKSSEFYSKKDGKGNGPTKVWMFSL